MRDLIDLDDLLIYLYAECLLTRDDIEKLKVIPSYNTRNDVILKLADLIERKGEKGLVKFMSALRKSASQGYQPGHRDLLKLLEDDLKAGTESSTRTQLTRRRIRDKEDPKQTNTSERDVLHELGCQLFNTCEYRALQRYDHNVRILTRCVCAVLLTYQFVVMTLIVTLCEDSGFLAAFQESENKRSVGYIYMLRSFLLIALRIGTRVVTPVLFLTQLDVLAATPKIPKSRLKVHEAIQQILNFFSPRHRERIEPSLSDPSAVINISGELIKRNIKLRVLHSLFFTWLLYYLGAFNVVVDKVIKREGIYNLHFLYTTTIHPQ